MKANRDRIAPHGRKGRFLPILHGVRPCQIFFHAGCCNSSGGDFGDLHLFIRQAKAGADMSCFKQIFRCRKSDRARRRTGCQRDIFIGKFVIGLEPSLVLFKEFPIGDGPQLRPLSRQPLWRHIRMDKQQGVCALCPGQMAQLICRPGCFQCDDKDIIGIYLHLKIGEDQQIHLFCIEFERDQATRPLCQGNMAQPPPTRDTPCRGNFNIAQFGGPIAVGCQVAATNKADGDFTGSEICLNGFDPCHYPRTPTNV